MYSARQKMSYEPCGCDSRPSVPGWVLDLMAERKLKAGYDTRKNNMCPDCYTYRSKNGTCNCT